MSPSTGVIKWQWTPFKRLLLPSDMLFEDGDIFCCLADKQFLIDKETVAPKVREFTCNLSSCSESFVSLSSYELHYHQRHYNRCHTCHRSFPSSHLLHIHILETHDSLFLLRAPNQNCYECLVESCPEKFPSSCVRRDHLVRVHRYPPGFRFHRSRKARSRQPCVRDKMEVDVKSRNPPDNPNTTSRLIFSHKVPRNITFGKGVPRTFLRAAPGSKRRVKHWHQTRETTQDTSRVDISNVDMTELTSALQDVD